MKANYEDIKALTSKEPVWYDMNGVPRYAKFHPNLCPNIYATEVILLKIQCQSCEKPFLVEMHWDYHNNQQSISDAIQKGNLGYIHYGDPPRHGIGKDGERYCYAGDTMNAESVKIVEFWVKTIEWERLPQYEIAWEDNE